MKTNEEDLRVKINNMITNEELRVKVAEICNWTEIVFLDEEATTGYEKTKRVCLGVIDPNASYKASVPNYPEDLNAMHEAEKIFIQEDGCVWGEKWETYCNHLADICFMAEPVNCLMRTTARQRAIAFVLTFN